jgi:hypothetical protein
MVMSGIMMNPPPIPARDPARPAIVPMVKDAAFCLFVVKIVDDVDFFVDVDADVDVDELSLFGFLGLGGWVVCHRRCVDVLLLIRIDIRLIIAADLMEDWDCASMVMERI